MNIVQKNIVVVLSSAFILTLSACAPEVGSDQWCSDLKEKNTADLTANEAKDFAKHCIFK